MSNEENEIAQLRESYSRDEREWMEKVERTGLACLEAMLGVARERGKSAEAEAPVAALERMRDAKGRELAILARSLTGPR
jgi:hypothetical protein